MRVDLQRLRADARRLKSTRARSPIGKPKTGATEIIRKHVAELNRLHREENMRWSELAAALADQGVTQGDGERITGRRLTALMRNLTRQSEKKRTDKTDRMARSDLAVRTAKPQPTEKLTLAPELTRKQSGTTQQAIVSEDAIRQAAFARHAQLLNKK